MLRPREAPPAQPGPGGSDAGLVLVTLWSSGPDPAQDSLLRVQAARSADQARLDLVCAPAAAELAQPAFAARVQREFGLGLHELGAGLDASDAWRELAEFAGAARVVVADLESFEAWRAHFAGGEHELARAIGLCEIAALFLPGRWSARREELVASLLGASEPAHPRAHGPDELARAAAELFARIRALAPELQAAARAGYGRALEALRESDPRLAERLALALELALPAPARESQAEHRGLHADASSDAGEELEELLEGLEPRAARDGERWAALAPLPPRREGPLPFADEDFERLERIFRERLPARFAREHPGAGSSYRAGQHEVAREVARTLAAPELLLVHAPTGTGKTLAYLVPLLLWSLRHEMRCGVATFTRALQEQAFDREVPRALAMLAEEGIPGGLRVSLLKGRENYLCWRALKLARPGADEDGAVWLAWTQLALFALTDLEGDLDRLPLRLALPAESGAALLAAASELRRAVRAQSACCRQREDKRTCTAELARLRAERSHLVIVNQAFALAVPEFVRHVVFDECEHLHEQAHNAWSKSLSLRGARAVLARLAQPGKSASRAPLDRLARQLLEGTPSRRTLHECLQAHRLALGALELAGQAAQDFLDWRAAEERDGLAQGGHTALANYAGRDEGARLLAARIELGSRLAGLEADLAELAARLDALGLRTLAQARRQLDLARVELAALFAALEAWMPLEEERPVFRAGAFHDVERDPRGDLVLVSRVLLPNEFLGRNYYPELANAVFLSATTWIAEGFDAALGYLGLERAAHPAPEEERPAARVRTFRAPDPFDYSRVLLAVPTDAPSAAQDSKQAFLDYVRRFVAHLGERTRGRLLVLFTNAADARRVGEELAGFFRARRIPLWFQNQEGTLKEELSELFRARVDSVLLGVDTFWYGADFPGETLEYLVIVKLPYGVPDRYHEAQCAALGTGVQRKRIYLPRALAKFRQGFGRLMRRESDRGVVFVLDARVLEARHRMFLKELPLENPLETLRDPEHGLRRARMVRGDTERCLREAFAHMGLAEELRRRGLAWGFVGEATQPPATEDIAGGGAEDAAGSAGNA